MILFLTRLQGFNCQVFKSQRQAGGLFWGYNIRCLWDAPKSRFSDDFVSSRWMILKICGKQICGHRRQESMRKTSSIHVVANRRKVFLILPIKKNVVLVHVILRFAMLVYQRVSSNEYCSKSLCDSDSGWFKIGILWVCIKWSSMIPNLMVRL